MRDERFSGEFRLAVLLSCTITIVISAITAALCGTAIAYRWKCEAGDLVNATGDKYFIMTLYRIYIQDEACGQSLVAASDLTRSQAVFTMCCVSLAISVLSILTATALAAVVSSGAQQIAVAAVSYVTAGFAALVLDVTLGAHFAKDLAVLSGSLADTSPGLAQNYERDVLRASAVLLLCLAMKGGIYHLVNTPLLGYIVVQALKRPPPPVASQHNIHKLGPLNAFEEARGQPSSWVHRRSAPNSMMEDDLAGISQWSRSLNDIDPPPSDSSRREDRWMRARPFSYLPPPPPVPAPDYSPPAVPRLKSALKQGYP